MEIKRIFEEYYEQLYNRKFNALDEMGQFLERQRQAAKTHTRINDPNSPVSIKEFESMTDNLPKQKV